MFALLRSRRIRYRVDRGHYLGRDGRLAVTLKASCRISRFALDHARAALSQGRQPNSTTRDEHRTDYTACPDAERKDLFRQDSSGNDRYAREVHDAADEQQRHQHPAASEAEQAVS